MSGYTGDKVLAARTARAVEIMANDGYWEHRRDEKSEWSTVLETQDRYAAVLRMLSAGHDVRRHLKMAESPYSNTRLVNTAGLDAHQVGDGYRLLLPWEVDGRFANRAEVWSVAREDARWVPAAHCKNDSYTYRVPVSVPWSLPPAHYMPADGRPLHNPAELNSWQVGAHRRLLLREEVGEHYKFKDRCWLWLPTEKRWVVDAEHPPGVGGYDQTYCVRRDEPWPAVPKPQHWTAADFVPGTYGANSTMDECGNGLAHPPVYYPLALLRPFECNGNDIGYNYKGWRQFTFEEFAASHIVLPPGGNWQKPFKTQQ